MRPGSSTIGLETLDSRELFEQVLDESRRRAVWILKHSTACGTSYFALREFERFAERATAAAEGGAPPRFLVLDLLRHRALSSEIAERTGVRHQSPQVLLLGDGEAVWSASHGAVTVARLEQARPGESIAPPPLFR